MKKITLGAALCVTALAAMTPAAAQAACPNTDLSIRGASDKPARTLLLTRSVTCLVNQERARYGLPRVTFDAKLAAAAQKHNDDMVAQKYFEHDSKDGRTVGQRVTNEGYEWGAVSENIALNTTPRTVVDAWLKSPGHCRNTLSPDVTQLGVGVTEGPAMADPGLEGNDTWTQVYARSIDSAVPSTDNAPRDGCPRSLGADQSGDGDDGTGAPPRGSAGGVKEAVIGLVSFRTSLTGKRTFTLAGSTAPATAGRRLKVTIKRGKRTIVRHVTTTSGGAFAAKFSTPKGGKGKSRITVSLPGKKGVNTAAKTTQVVGATVATPPVV